MYRDLDERHLAEQCRKGDSLAADELYRRYAARLLTLCRRYCSDWEEARDLMQETMVRAIEKIHGFHYRSEGSLYAWLSKIAVNKALSNIRKQKREITTDLAAFPQLISEPDTDGTAAIPQETLLELISRLPAARKAVFNLYCIDGYSHREIGKMLGISEKASSSILAKARAQLKHAINNYLKESE